MKTGLQRGNRLRTPNHKARFPTAPARRKRRVTPYHRWSAAETRIADRFAKMMIRERYRSANAAIGDCRDALRRTGFLSHLDSRTIGNKLRKRSSDLGRPLRYLHWSSAQTHVAERFAQAVVAGRYADVNAAVPDCRKALKQAGLQIPAARTAIAAKLWRLTERYGRLRRYVGWAAGEEEVAERFARAVLTGRYRHVTEAVSDCRKALDRLGLPGRRTPTGVRHHLNKTARRLGRPLVSVKWSTTEEEIISRFARAVVQREYRTIATAAPVACRALSALGLQFGRTRQAVVDRLRARTRDMGHGAVRQLWTRQEIELADRHARAMADGTYGDAMEAARACAAAMNRLRQQHPARYREMPPRSLSRIHGVLLPRIRELIYPWRHTKWLKAELRLVDLYARAAVEHRYPSVLHAARACHKAVERLHVRRQRGMAHRATQIRAVHSVFDKVMRRAKTLGRYRLPGRRWTPEEHQVSARWGRKYRLHREGKLRMNLPTVAKLMQAELDRLGYYRTLQACAIRVIDEAIGQAATVPARSSPQRSAHGRRRPS